MMKYQHKITSEIISGLPVISIEGDMTSDADSDIKKLYSEIKEKFPENKTIIINFEKTKYINSSGIATLINIIQDINEKKGMITFVGMSDHLKKVMDIVGITDFVKLFDNKDQAVNSLAH
jgi:anti-anti-sigma factor